MPYILLSLLVSAILLAAVPAITQQVTNRPPKHVALLVVACVLLLVSWFLPSPRIDGQDTAFSTHFVGGGLFTGFVWLYLIKNLGWRLGALAELATLYLVVSALGVASELAELAAVKAGLSHLPLTDTTWDLVANTSGALAFWIGYRVSRPAPRKLPPDSQSGGS